MTETANVQLNNIIPLPYAQPYIKIPAGLNSFPSGVQLVGGLIYSFSGEQDSEGVYSTICRKRKAMKESLTLSFATLTRSVAHLIEKGYVSRLSRDEYIFNRDKLKGSEFTRIEFNEISRIMKGCTRVQGVRVRVFAWFNTRCNIDKKSSDSETERYRKEHKVAASYAEIAAAVGCSERQAIRAVKWLLKHDYIHRPECDKGTSITDKSIYSLDRAYWRRKKRKEQKLQESQAQKPSDDSEELTPEQKAEKERNARLERVKEQALADAHRNNQRAQRSKRYVEAHKRVVSLNIEIAFKELHNPERVAELEAERARWVSEENAALNKLGLSAELLDEDYLFKLYSAAEPPPGDDKQEGAGELNKK